MLSFVRPRQGQSMLIAVLAIGGAMLAATTIAGLLILYQLRATTNSVASSQAIFAADSGTDWALYSYFCAETGRTCPPSSPAAPFTYAMPASGAKATITCYDAEGDVTSCSNATTTYAVSRGTSLNTSRAFYLQLTASTTTFP